jgi:aminoglycoside phosphotransferase (APT) family kinase protein
MQVPEGERLTGGNMSGVVRHGDRVHRTAGPWTPTVHRLLRHLHDRGVTGVPRPYGFDADGREVVTYVPGTVPQDPMPGWVWTDSVLAAAGRRLAALHEATADFPPDDGAWQLPSHQPAEVVCHNDFAPYNLAFDDEHRLSGVIDWDTASPGPRVWDLAYLAYRLVPLSDPANPDLLGSGIGERRRRLALLCGAYGGDVGPAAVAEAAVTRLHELADFTAARAAAGAHHVAGHVRLYRTDARWLAAHLTDLS